MTAIVEPELKTSKPTVWSILLTTLHVLIVLTAFLVCFVAYRLGFLFNVLFVFLVVLLAAGICSRAAGAHWKTLEFGFIRRPFGRTFRPYLLQCLNQWMFLFLTAVTLRLAIVPAQFAPSEYRALQMMVWGMTGVLMALALVPQKRVRISTNSFFALGWLFLGMEWLRVILPSSTSEAVALAPPFLGEWYIFQGGRSALINHHYPVGGQRYALDIVKTIDGREVHGADNRLESYPAYGQVLYAPADGKIAKVVSDRPDMAIGKTDREQIAGNHLVLDIGQGRFVLMAHLKQGSVRVSPGERVRRGQAVAACGNSGNTSEPHLHLQVQSHADFNTPDLRTFPIVFRDVMRVRSGHREQLKEADVRRNDIVFGPEDGLLNSDAPTGMAFTEKVAAQQSEKGKRMEGTWTCESATVDGKPLAEATIKLLRLTLTKARYKTEKGTEVLFESDYTLDATQNPAHIDIVGTEGDLKGRTAQGIYSLAGDTLKICYTMPGGTRPTTFESAAGSGAYFIVWKRQQP